MNQPGLTDTTTRLAMAALQEISGAQYAMLLKEAGWERFLTDLPARI
ncbi:MAG TPA: hypothetical protein VKY74_27155 [Chloroflexia bacterium]|nr:hypothetical protein [Chloroflexia bacterium]